MPIFASNEIGYALTLMEDVEGLSCKSPWADLPFYISFQELDSGLQFEQEVSPQ